MGAYTVHKNKTATLVANTVDTITFDQTVASIEILSVDGAAEIYYVIGNAGIADPTVGGDNEDMLPAAIGGVEERVADFGSGVDPDAIVVKLISSGTPKYSVKGF